MNRILTNIFKTPFPTSLSNSYKKMMNQKPLHKTRILNVNRYIKNSYKKSRPIIKLSKKN